MRKILYLVVILACIQCTSQNKIPNQQDQINGALQAAPENKRAGAAVLGYDNKGNLISLKKGTNELICLANNPKGRSFSTACYHKDLGPFMARGRALKAQGKSRGEIFAIREKEAKSGQLKMPNHPSTLYVLYGKNAVYDKSLKRVLHAHYRYVVYIPWATSASTGLPTRPQVQGGPWIMDPGTHKAHIMIVPPIK